MIGQTGIVYVCVCVMIYMFAWYVTGVSGGQADWNTWRGKVLSVYVCMWWYTCVCIYVCMCVCVHTYIHIYIHIYIYIYVVSDCTTIYLDWQTDWNTWIFMYVFCMWYMFAGWQANHNIWTGYVWMHVCVWWYTLYMYTYILYATCLSGGQGDRDTRKISIVIPCFLVCRIPEKTRCCLRMHAVCIFMYSTQVD